MAWMMRVWYKLTNTTGIPGGSEGSLLAEKLLKNHSKNARFYTNNNEKIRRNSRY